MNSGIKATIYTTVCHGWDGGGGVGGNYMSKGPRNQPEIVPTGTICDKIINNLNEK